MNAASSVTRRRRLAAAVLAGAAAIGTSLLSALGSLSGVGFLILVGVVWLGIPSSHVISRRLAVNGAIGLGAIPLFYWLPVTPWGDMGRAGVLVGVALGVLVLLLMWSPESRAKVLLRPDVVDVLPMATVGFSAWFFLPLARVVDGNALDAVITAFGNDNVAHFTMFTMTRRFQAGGAAWGSASDGSDYAYEIYPQHFHSLAAFVAEGLHGPIRGSVQSELVLFCLATAIVLSIALVTLVAAICSIPVLRVRPLVALIPSIAAPGLLLLGFGATTLQFGFPNFLLAIIATATAVVFVMGRVRYNTQEVAASAALAILVAHSWALLTPVALGGFVVAMISLPLAHIRGHPSRYLPIVAIGVITLACGVYAAVLVWLGTVSSGSPEEALATPGGVLAIDPLLALVVVALVVALSVSAVISSPLRSRLVVGSGASPLVAGIMGLAVATGLIVIQLRRTGALAYFQLKYLNGLFLVFCVVLVVLCFALAAVILFSRPSSPVSQDPRPSGLVRIGMVVLVGAATVASIAPYVVAVSGVRLDPPSETIVAKGLDFRDAVADVDPAESVMASRIERAATAMGGEPCRRPILIDTAGPIHPIQANQWAMALSGEWSVNATAINAELWISDGPERTLDDLVLTLLDGHESTCALMTSDEAEALAPEIRAEFALRLILI